VHTFTQDSLARKKKYFSLILYSFYLL